MIFASSSLLTTITYEASLKEGGGKQSWDLALDHKYGTFSLDCGHYSVVIDLSH